MNISEVATTSCVTAARLILTTTRPLQGLVDQAGEAHNYCNQQAIQILKNDGWNREGVWLESYLECINAGTSWADKGWKNVTHYYNPLTRRGLSGWPTATEECSEYFRLAMAYIKQLKFDEACFYLGAAAHLVQDLCVPHHSRNVVFAGHQKYEKWVKKHAHNYLVYSKGMYSETKKDAGEWVIANAQASFDYFSQVNSFSLFYYHQTTEAMLSRAQRTTAGFFHYFLSKVGLVNVF